MAKNRSNMTISDFIDKHRSTVRREVCLASHLRDGILRGATLPPAMERAWFDLMAAVAHMPKKTQRDVWESLSMLMQGSRELRDVGPGVPESPPNHLWSVRAAIREGARNIVEASQITGLPVYALSLAWDYAKNNPVSIVDEVGTLERSPS